MNFSNIISINGKCDRKFILENLNGLNDSLFGLDWKYGKGISSFTKSVIPNRQCFITLGNEHLYAECSQNEVNKAGYIIAVEHSYHEYRHVQQLTTERKLIHDKDITSNDRRMTDIIRRDFVSDMYNTIYGHTYRIHPGELDAETYGIQKTIEYFANDKVVSQSEAKDILVQIMMSDDYGHKEELEPYNVKTAEDLMSAFIDLRNKAVHLPYQINAKPVESFEDNTGAEYDMTNRFLTEHRFKYFREEFNKCTDGRMQDKILEQTIVMEYPEIITSVPRLEKELRACQEQMRSRLFVSSKEAIPESKIQYANPDDEFTRAVETIRTDEDIKL